MNGKITTQTVKDLDKKIEEQKAVKKKMLQEKTIIKK
jgi:hypothetical protein